MKFKPEDFVNDFVKECGIDVLTPDLAAELANAKLQQWKDRFKEIISDEIDSGYWKLMDYLELEDK